MFNNILRNHFFAILLALIIGIATLVPQLVAQYRLGDRYHGVPVLWEGDDLFYVVRAHDVIDGYPTIGNPYLLEHKNEKELQFWLPDALLAWGSMYFFHDLQTGSLFWDFLIPLLLALITYAISYTLTQSKYISLASVIFLHIGLYLEHFNRSPSPQFTTLFMLPLVYFLIRAIQTRATSWYVWSALTFGLLFYIYTYYWTFWVVALGCTVVLLYIFARNEKLHVPFFLTLLTGLVIGIPYFLGLLQVSRLSYYNETVERIGMIYSHKPTGYNVLLVVLVTLCYFLFARYKKYITNEPIFIFLFASTLAGAVVVNQQLVTGKILSFSIHYILIAMFMCVFTCIAVFARQYKTISSPNKKIFAQILFVLVLGCSLFAAGKLIALQVDPTRGIASQRYGEVLRWLNKNTSRDDVVYSDDELSRYIAAYTHNNVYYAHEANLFYVPQSEINRRFVVSHYFDSPLTRPDLVRFERFVFGTYYIEHYAHEQSANRYKRLLGLSLNTDERYPEEKMSALIKLDSEIKSGSFVDAIAPYRVDYIVWDRAHYPNWDLAKVPQLKQLVTIGDFIVYTFIK